MHAIQVRSLFVAALCVATLSSAQHKEHDPRALALNPLATDVQIAPILDGIGENHLPISTSSEQAQKFFDQGLKLTYAFNHQEALRAFKEAVRLDPNCAMAYWGWALVLGPNLNLPMKPDVVGQAHEASQKALSLIDSVSPKERGFIEAMAERYGPEPEEDRSSRDLAYAEAMGKLHAGYPEDNDAATLYAAALMNLTPWNYWTPAGQPKGDTETILALLEQAMRRDPSHEGALHYYIHLVEPVDPWRGELAADRLTGLAPMAGHLVHMPSHIYMQIGRYADAYDANEKAVDADEGYVTACRSQGIYPLTYYPHNIHFLGWAAIMEGRASDALAAANKVASRVPMDMHGNDWALYQTFLSMPYYVQVRFGMWDEILETPSPDPNVLYVRGMWHYARGLAFTHKGDLDKAKQELAAVSRTADDPARLELLIGFSNAGTLLQIAKLVLSGEILAKQKSYDEAVAHLDRAVRLEESLLYSEPPDWYYPVRHTLGAVLVEAGRAKEAEVVYWQDLKKNAENGYSLRGLAQALRAQGRDSEAKEIEQRYHAAWKAADAQLSSSRF